MAPIQSKASLVADLNALGVVQGYGLFVHASMSAVQPVVGGLRAVMEALQDAVGPGGLVAIPGFCDDACFPQRIDRDRLSLQEVEAVERAVLGYDIDRSPTAEMGVIADTFRRWPGKVRSTHPAVSVFLNGAEAERYVTPHSVAWATGANTPLFEFASDWIDAENRCSGAVA